MHTVSKVFKEATHVLKAKSYLASDTTTQDCNPLSAETNPGFILLKYGTLTRFLEPILPIDVA